ncbi:MAG: neutral zinc metallopeptidase [Hyphomicrobiaceae bacterium]
MVQWRGRRESDNVEDRRGEGGGFPFPGQRGGRGGIPFPMPGGRKGGGIGIVGLLIMLGIALLLGINPLDILVGGGNQFPMPRVDTEGKELPKFDLPNWPGADQVDNQPSSDQPQIKPSDDLASYVKVVLADTEDVWTKMFAAAGRRYQEPTLVMFDGMTQTACGPGMTAMGPFYCPLDQKVYIDLTFYQQMRTQFGAGGDFAQAYVIAHEVGHHVQKLLGIADRVQAYKQQVGERDANAVQVRMELQADCYAGVWANLADRSKGILEQGDIEEGLNAASAIGDDNIQRQTQGRVVPDAFTHGSSEQRVRWFKRGLETGNPSQCDTFNAEEL